jgi:hypothetical protein
VYLRRCYRAKDGERHAYWALVKSVRTVKGPRQKVVAYLGDLDEADRLGVQQAAAIAGDGSAQQQRMFNGPSSVEPRWMEVDVEAGAKSSRLRVCAQRQSKLHFQKSNFGFPTTISNYKSAP